MDAREFEYFAGRLGKLTRRQAERLLALLGQVSRRERAAEVIEKAALAPDVLGWRWALDGHRINTPETLLRAAIGVFSHT